FDPFQRQLTDIFFLTKANTPDVSKNVVLVAVDDKSIVELKAQGRFPVWPRSLHAQVVRQLTDARARTIVFDILFDVPGQGDDDLAAAIDDAEGRATFVVLSTAADPLGRRDLGPDSWETFSEAFDILPN